MAVSKDFKDFFGTFWVLLVSCFLAACFLASAQTQAQIIKDGKIEVRFVVDGKIEPLPIDTQKVISNIDVALLSNSILTELGKTSRYRDFVLSKGASTDGKIIYVVAAKRQKRLYDVSFSGLGLLEESQYRRVLKSQVGTAFSEQDVDLDVSRLLARLSERGYTSARVTRVNFEENPDGDIRIVFDVTRGTPCRVADVFVEPEASVLDFITAPIEPGSICDKIAIEDDLERERNRLRADGYLESELKLVSMKTTDDKGRAAVRLLVVPGVRTRIEVVNQTTGAITEDLSQGKGGLSPFDLVYFSNEDLRNEVTSIYQKRGFANALVTGPTKYISQRNENMLRFFVQPGLQMSIGNIEFRGLLPLPKKEVIEKLELEPKFLSFRVPYIERDMPDLREKLISIYFDSGYADVQVDGPIVTFSPDGRLANLLFRIDTGDQFIVRDFTVLGQPRGFEADTAALSQILGPGEAVSKTRLRNLEDETKIELIRAGYAYAQVKARMNVLPAVLKNKPVQIILEIDHGPIVYIGQVFAEGELYGKQDRVIAETGLEAGMLFTPEHIDRARVRLLKHDLFGSVAIEPLTPAALERRDTVIDLVVRTQGRSGFTLGLSPGYGTRNGYRFSIDFTKNNLTSDGLRLNSSASISQEKLQGAVAESKQILGRKISVGLTEPLFRIGSWISPFDLTTTTGAEVAAEPLNNRFFETYDFGFSWKPLFWSRSWNFGAKFAHEWSKIIGSGLAPFEALDRPTIRIHEIVLGASVDTRNVSEWPTSGSLSELTSSHARFGLLSDVQYDRYNVDVSTFFPIVDRLSGALSLGGMRLSNVINQRRETVTAPGSRRSSLSGRSLVRGYAEGGSAQSPGPLIWLNLQPPEQNPQLDCSPTLRPVGATNLLYLKSELRYRTRWLSDSVGFVVFADTGSSYFTEAEQLKIRESLKQYESSTARSGSANECAVKGASLVGTRAVKLQSRTFFQDYVRSSYVSSGVGVRYIIPGFAYVSFDWGIPLRDPSDGDSSCVTAQDAQSGQTPPPCVKRRSTDKFLFVIPVPGTLHVGIGASF